MIHDYLICTGDIPYVNNTHSPQHICYLTEAPYILSQLCASFDYFLLVNWIADSLQRWISLNTIYQKPEHFRVCLRKPQLKKMFEGVHAFNSVSLSAR